MKPTKLIITASILLAATGCDKHQDTPAASRLNAELSAAGVRLDGLRKLALIHPDLGSRVGKAAPPLDPSRSGPEGQTTVDAKIASLQSSLERDPRKVDTWVLLGRAWVQKARQAADPGYYANAGACADVALDLRPKYPLAMDLRALVLMNNHAFAEARDLATATLAEDSDDMMALGVAADALLELGDFEKASAMVQRMIDLKPCLPSYARASYIRWLEGDTREAKQIIRLAMDAGLDQRDPEPGAWVTVEAAKMFWHEGDYPGADAGFDRALSRFPDYAPALLGKARVAIAAGRFEDAAKLARRSYEASPLAETAWVWGDAERLAGHDALAKEAHDRVVKLGRQGDRRTLAMFFATEDRDIGEALTAIEAEVKVRGDVYTHDAYAWALYRAGKLEAAKAESDKAMRLGTKDALLLYHAGAIQAASGDKRGLDRVRQALKLSPMFQARGALEARALLKASAGGAA
jgi:tetratricopeptide (TPR) repeat protein